MKPSPRNQAICLPVTSEDHYRQLVDDLPAFRDYLLRSARAHPELFPRELQGGFTFHHRRHSQKLDLPLRRIQLKATGQVFLVRPSFALPYMTGRTTDVEKALYLRQWGVPFDALAYVFGRDAKYWERQWYALGRPSLVGTTVKDPDKLPRHLVADEKHTRQQGDKAYVATTAGEGCLLGAAVTASAREADLTEGYGEFAAEARALNPQYSPESVCLDGWSATQNAWQTLFPKVTVILCFLHAVLKILQTCLQRYGPLRQALLDRTWRVYRAANRRSFAQGVRRLRAWAEQHLPAGPLREAVRKLCRRQREYGRAYAHPEGHRTTNMVDRLMDYQDRVLYSSRYLHGGQESARLGVRAQAMLWNFHPYGARMRRQDTHRLSPFQDLNGFVYHSNWFENFLIASSMGGKRL